MATKSNNDTIGYVKKETTLLVALLTLAIGFFVGVMFGIYRSAPVASVTPGQGMPPQGMPPGAATSPQVSSELSSRIAALEQKAAENPTDAETWIQLGNNFFDSNQFAKAIDAYNKALELNPKNANVWTDLGVMYRRSGKPDEAIKAFDRAISVDPKHEVSRFNKGVVLLHDLDDTAGAIQAWEGLIAVNPLAMSPTGTSVDQMVQQMKAGMAQAPATKQ
jgi:cytochrome c-type biogenesis protein CcmH/NrfG